MTLLAPSLTLIIQTSLSLGILTDNWKKAFVIPVYKRVIILVLQTI